MAMPTWAKKYVEWMSLKPAAFTIKHRHCTCERQLAFFGPEDLFIGSEAISHDQAKDLADWIYRSLELKNK
jgi:hypothetical protein